MTTRAQKVNLYDFSNPLLLFWGVILLVSSLPNILWYEGTGQSDGWLLQPKLLVLGGLLALSWVRKDVSAVRPLVMILMVLAVAEWAMAEVGASVWWQGWFRGEQTFVTSMMSIQVGRLLVAFVVVGMLFMLNRSRHANFLTRGDTNAVAQPVALLGMKERDRWGRFGIISLITMSGVLLTFLVLAGRPTPTLLRSALPLLPFVVLFAVMNAWSEEISYRVSLIATTEPIVGSAQAVWLSAVYFGIGHFYGVPYGIVGVLLSTFFGYLLGKSLVETRGLAWAWGIHILADIWVFTFMAIGSVTPGG